MTDLDDELKRRYRALATEEPSAVIDAAILARSRRRRPWIARWSGPVSIAAVLVLGIGVSLRMQLEQAGIETSVPDTRALESSSGAAPAAAPPAIPTSKDEARRDAFVASPPETMLAQKRTAAAPAKPPHVSLPGDPKVSAPQELKERVADTRAPEANVAASPSAAPSVQFSTTTAIVTAPPPAPAVAPAAPPPAPLGRVYSDEMRPQAQAAPHRNEPVQAPLRAKQEAEADRAAPATAAATDSGAGVRALHKSIVVETDPARELERIAKLREVGDHSAADKALAEFRKRFPDFRIPDAMWEKVRPR